MSDDSLSPELLQKVKATVRARILEDRQRVTDDVGALLEAIDARLYDPGLRARDLLERAGDPEILFRFRLQLGLDVDAYREQRRLEAAYELVVGSTALIGEIAVSLGFPEAEIFSKWFKRRTGRSPERLRAFHRQQECPATSPARAVAESARGEETAPALTFHDWQRALVEVLESGRLDELIRFCVDHYPEAASQIPALSPTGQLGPVDVRARRRR